MSESESVGDDPLDCIPASLSCHVRTNYGVFEKALSLSWTPLNATAGDRYMDPVAGAYIADYPAGHYNNHSFPTLEVAQAVCNSMPATVCGGVTLQVRVRRRRRQQRQQQ